MREKQNAATIVLTFLLFFFFQLLSTIAAVTAYRPVENFKVNCGSSVNSSSLDGRNWTGDEDSSIELSNSKNSSLSANPLDKTIPYNTARLSRSEFSYSFTVTGGQKFIRLYFYPSSYNSNFLRDDAFFSVKAGPYTLLKDFNASLNADACLSLNFAEPNGAIVREYCVNVDSGQRLTITLTPNPSHPNAYAFVNGIEIVSMPTFLYYTNPDNEEAMMLDGRIQKFPVNNNSALETLYRTNVGGREIPSDEDTGMFRYWEQDNDYLELERSYSVSAGFGLKLDYKGYPNYTAPDEVYLTARKLGMNDTSKFNVTWEFQVDSVFTYMVRLHFCEFDEKIETVGERVFQIFINDALVEPHADVISWTQKMVPAHRDYAVSMPPSHGSLKKLNLSIKLQANPYARSAYRDVLLNGIEILKISDLRNNLGGPNPDPLTSNKNPPKMRVISILVGSVSGFILLSLIVLLTYCPLARAAINEGNSHWGTKPESTSKTNKSSQLPSDLCRCFSISEVKEATSNFDDSLIIGVEGLVMFIKAKLRTVQSLWQSKGSNKVHNKASKSLKLRLKFSLNFVTIIWYLSLVSATMTTR